MYTENDDYEYTILRYLRVSILKKKRIYFMTYKTYN